METDNSTIKLGAIWARVSTDRQAETSIPTQVDCSKAKAESLGYTIPKDFVLTTDRTSLQLNDDPKFLELYDLITKRKIKAIFLLDRDRLQAEPLERLSFISLCKENGVQIIPCQGPELLDSDEGQLIEMVLAIGKKKSVLRAQLGSKQGLHDRVTRERKPVTYHKLYGYSWLKPNTLIPNQDWPTVKLIFDQLRDNKSYDTIIKELHRRGIPSPSGQMVWTKTAIHTMVHSPTYAGRYYGLRQHSVLPKKRRGNTYGKSSMVYKPQGEWVYVPEIKVQDPPITWEERQKILDQIVSHMKLSQRHAKYDYMLRGFIFCREHYGKGGRPRVYHGHPREKRFYYACPVPGCRTGYIPGVKLEQFVMKRVGLVLATQPEDYYKFLNADNKIRTRQQIEADLSNLSAKRDKLDSKMARLEDDRYSDRITEAVYGKLKDKYNFERTGIENQTNTVLDELSQLGQDSQVIDSLNSLRFRFYDRLFGGNTLGGTDEYPGISTAEWREIFSALGLEVTPATADEREKKILAAVAPDGAVDLNAYEQLLNSKEFMPAYDINIKLNIPLSNPKLRQKLGSIGLANPASGEPNHGTYPLILSPFSYSPMSSNCPTEELIYSTSMKPKLEVKEAHYAAN